MSKAWLFQKLDDVRDLGEENAPWLVGWLEPDGRRRSKTVGVGPGAKKTARRLAGKITAELMTGTYETKARVPWDEFVADYARRVLDGLEPRSKAEALTSLAHYKRLMRPARVDAVTTGHVDEYVASRRKEPGLKRGSAVSPATVNKELRQLKAAFNAAADWGYLAKAPRFRLERQVKKLPRFVTPDHFAAIYGACDGATLPAGLPYPAADWWRGLLVFGYMTGWRISDMLALRRDDLDLAAGYAVTRGEDNKGGRDDRVKLHPVLVEHLTRLASFEPLVFPWARSERVLRDRFDRVQRAAGIDLPCPGRHEHTPSCRTYGFHDLRRAFATMNAPRLTADALQALMRHKSYLTTQVYINMARQVDEAVDVLHVPEFLRRKEA